MKVLDLRCGQGHGFEGWFGSEDDYRGQRARGLVTCPVCRIAEVAKLPSAPRLNLGSARGDRAPEAQAGTAVAVANEPASRSSAVAPESTAEQAARWRAARALVGQAENVGSRFADEARRIHHGEAAERSIRGQATPDEAHALREEGIGVLPLPAALTETLQ
ncbi:DUF1178 family protein [Xylophilus ampelinus]|uniref:DUF1178 family protein n=1 Tax=Xylophilus ampelinus TaxID=54067 RepID=A0A318SK36_9BURK|nr:DUF1178 family protein [Xylophilus ampelinus]MCS4508804.1 DUF1178 family protein [Xylophilus ampelinus]PYE79374.1 hypothetical protein DFQ15_102106 [Xylophilus ampelinus]